MACVEIAAASGKEKTASALAPRRFTTVTPLLLVYLVALEPSYLILLD